MPKPHYEANRGYALTDGDTILPINDYFDLTLKGNIFANGSWLTTAQTSYNKRYKYSGNFSFSYANNISGIRDYLIIPNLQITRLGWNFNPECQGNARFQILASVNMSSSRI